MKNLFTTLSVLLLLSACTQQRPTITPGREDMLRKGKWKVSSGKITFKLPSSKDTTVDYYNFIMPVCHQDDYIIFDSLYKAAIYAGATKCNPGEADFIPFKWRLINNGNNIDLYDGFNNIFGFTDSVQFSFD